MYKLVGVTAAGHRIHGAAVGDVGAGSTSVLEAVDANSRSI